eukprot:gene12864-15108_t
MSTLYIRGDDEEDDGSDPINPYDFSDPSPDDLILDRQKQAFKPKSSSTKPATKEVGKAIKNMNINQQSSSGPTPNNTPTSTSSMVSNEQNVNKNLNMKQHSAARRKALEEMVHQSFATTTKPHLNMVVIGHVDAGKSTTMGHLLLKLGYVDQRTINKYEREANVAGKSSFHFAWVLDEHDEERERGVTMDVCVRYFETDRRKITLLDAPGHRDFVPNMIAGTTQADVAVLLINASEFEAGFSSEGQTKEHALLAKSLGIMQLIVAINKMDMVGWSEDRYNHIVAALKVFLATARFHEASVRYIPISGYLGENLTTKSPDARSSWYTGPTLVEQIDSFSVGERLIDKPVRMGISDVYKSSSKGTVMVGGKIEAGVIGVGDKLLISPGNEICTVKAIRRSSTESEWAVGGDSVDLSLNVDVATALRVGTILSDPEKPIQVSKRFLAQVVTFTLPLPITNGYQAVLHAHSMEEPATISKLISLVDNAGVVTKKKPRCLADGATALVEITLPRVACLELYSNYRQLGRFTLRESGKTIAAD